MTTEYLIRAELEHVLAALTPGNRIVARTAISTGLRIGDVLAIRTEQLAPQFYVVEAKTGKKRRVNLSKDLLTDIRAQAGRTWAFPGRDPRKHRSRQAIWKDIKRAQVAFRLPQNLGPHSLRKYWSVEYLGKVHGDMGKLQRSLNHSSVGITYIYAMAASLYYAKYGTQAHK